MLLKRDIEQSLWPLTFVLVISGLSNAILIGIVNAAAENVSNLQVSNRFFFLFACTFALIVLSKRYVLDRASILVESILYRIRVRITDKIRHTELSTLEAVGSSSLYARLTTDVTTISNLSSNLVSSAQSFIMISFTIIYVGFVSLWSFVVLILGLTIGVLYVLNKLAGLRKFWAVLSQKQTVFFEQLGHILHGFKEVKINRSRNEEVFEHFMAVNSDLKATRLAIDKKINFFLILGQICLFLVMGTLLFILPHFHSEQYEDVFKVTAAVLFIAGPTENLMASLELLGNANEAAKNIMNLEAELEEELRKNRLGVQAQHQPESFESLPFSENIELKNLSYFYPPTKDHEHVFSVGPVNIKFRKGELIFITGGNGSGKSTLLKMITGLYLPKSGRIVLDAGVEGKKEQIVEPANYQQYRNLFSTIFLDFHLFDKLYGMQDVDPAVVNRILQNMELSEDKVVFQAGGFSNLNLSSGQRKRLVLASLLIEDKPIYVFDEVAADLDPEFRDKYYYEILRELKERHKTVIVVSHDRHYWRVPDRIFEMEDGNIRELSKEEITSLLNVTETD